jgi:zinc protease
MKLTRVLIAALSLALTLAGCQKDDDLTSVPVESAMPDSIALVEAFENSSSDAITIPYKKYVLDNGLTLILHEDRSDPLAHVDVTYHVGSGREEVGKSGFAHFFEHMMFQGTENVGDEQHFKIVSESGGTLNGSTTTDITNYYQTVPDNQIEKMLWLEADRMGFLLNAVTQEKFEVQRDTVKNERGSRVDNQPYGRLGEAVNEALLPEGHPYSWSTIGYLEDLDRVDVNDLKKFFLRWYGPNNATLTIGGKFDADQVLTWVDKYFAQIPRGPDVAMPEKPAVVLEADRYTSMEDDVALPLLYMSFPTVSAFHSDEAPLDVLMFVLGQGETSLLYKNMVKNGLAVQASAGHLCLELLCTITVYALPNPPMGASLSDLEKIIRDSLVEFEGRGIVEDDLIRAKMNVVAGMVYGLESVAGKVGRLASYEAFTGNPNYIADDIARYENVTEEDVMRVYRKYIKGKPAVVMSVVPNGQLDQVAKAETWSMYERSLPEYVAIKDEDLDFRRATDDFDRSVIPASGVNPTIILPEIWRFELENGIPVLGAINSETPTASINLRIEAGQRVEPLDKLGIAALTAAMMNEATTQSTNEELSNELQKLGSSVRFSLANEQTSLSIRSLSENLDATLAIAAERLLTPKFGIEDFERVKAQTIQSISQSKKQAGVTADVVYQMTLYGKENSFSYLNVGTEESVAALTLDDVKQFYADFYSPKIAKIIAVSDQSQEALTRKLAVFETWQGPDVIETDLKPFPVLGKTKLYLVDKPGAAQSEIRIGKRALSYDANGDYYRASLMNYALGAAFNSRINLNLREDKGYTYGARSNFVGSKDYGDYRATAAVRTDATSDSIVEFENEMRNYAEKGMSESELLFTRNSLGQNDARMFETPRQKLGFLANILIYDLDDDFVEQQSAILDAIGKSELDEFARKYLVVDDMIIVVVGDKQVILPGLESLGYEIIELDDSGNFLNPVADENQG